MKICSLEGMNGEVDNIIVSLEGENEEMKN